MEVYHACAPPRADQPVVAYSAAGVEIEKIWRIILYDHNGTIIFCGDGERGACVRIRTYNAHDNSDLLYIFSCVPLH